VDHPAGIPTGERAAVSFRPAPNGQPPTGNIGELPAGTNGELPAGG